MAAALRRAPIEKGWRVPFAKTTDLVRKLRIAPRDRALDTAIAKLEKYPLLILDDFAYVPKTRPRRACCSK